MTYNIHLDPISASLKQLSAIRIEPLDLMPRRNLVEKLIELMLSGPPSGPLAVAAGLEEVAGTIDNIDTQDLKVVVFGGGSGLSNVIGGDSRNPHWYRQPYTGLKEIFPNTSSIVCVTDDGGSTGELLKDLPLVAIGDLRHVLLSSVRQAKLQSQYNLTSHEALKVARVLHGLLNFRFDKRPQTIKDFLVDRKILLSDLPEKMAQGLLDLLERIFADFRLSRLLDRPHCLGNLLLVAAVYSHVNQGLDVDRQALVRGIKEFADLLGANPEAVLPCVANPAHLNLMYANGIVVSGEDKSSEAQRNCPVDRVFVEFSSPPVILPEVMKNIEQADIIIFAPGSLYTSIIPILQIPELAEAVRKNKQAMKILVANLWIQRGETDLVRDDPKRRFYVSDLIKAYHRNIPGGVKELFEQVLLLGLQDIPGNILQSYAVEGKMPIYLDRGMVWQMGFAPIEAKIFSESALHDRRVQHDPAALAQAVKTIWAVRHHIPREVESSLTTVNQSEALIVQHNHFTPSQRFAALKFKLKEIDRSGLSEKFEKIFWKHQDIRIEHLNRIKNISLVSKDDWLRNQHWDKVYSYYDPADSTIYIRQDLCENGSNRLETAFLVALGQSLLGHYAADKKMIPIDYNGETVGRIFQLTLRENIRQVSFFSPAAISRYLKLVRMNQSGENKNVYTRVINGNEGFTPPGLLMGLIYAWYLDNRLAPHVEYKMAIVKNDISDLVQEQIKMLNRRLELIKFFRKVVFRHNSSVYSPGS